MTPTSPGSISTNPCWASCHLNSYTYLGIYLLAKLYPSDNRKRPIKPHRDVLNPLLDAVQNELARRTAGQAHEQERQR